MISLAMAVLLLLQACYNDNYQDLYPQPLNCDTTNVTFGKNVLPIITSNCTRCHSGAVPLGNISLENYNDVVASVNGGRFMGSIKHEQGYSAMPKGGGKLSDCDIKHIEIWVASGMPNN